MRIVVLANNDIGLYKFRKELLKKMLEKHEVFICLPNGEWINSLEQIGCEYIPCEFDRRGMKPFSEFRLILKYLKILKRIKPDLVLTYTIKPNCYGGMVCSILGIPIIANVTGLGTSIENGGITQKVTLFMYRLGLKKAWRVFFQNEHNCRFMLEKHIVNGNYSILPGSGVNLIDNSFEEYPTEENGIRFLFVGRIMRDKGIEEYLYAAKTIHNLYPNCSFSIVGDYDDESYKDIIEQYEREGIVNTYGYQKDIHSFMKSHHILIHPSYHEGLSNVLLEAAACGRPVIASDIPGCKETFDEEISGFGFTPRDGEALVAVIEKILQLSTNERKKIGHCGRKKVEKEFDRKIVIDAYLSEIDSINKNIERGIRK